MLNQQQPKKLFSIFFWLSSKGFKQNREDLRDFTHPVNNAKVKLFILDKEKWMSIWDGDGNRMATMMQPNNAKDMMLVMDKTRIMPGKRTRIRTEQNDDFNIKNRRTK